MASSRSSEAFVHRIAVDHSKEGRSSLWAFRPQGSRPQAKMLSSDAAEYLQGPIGEISWELCTRVRRITALVHYTSEVVGVSGQCRTLVSKRGSILTGREQSEEKSRAQLPRSAHATRQRRPTDVPGNGPFLTTRTASSLGTAKLYGGATAEDGGRQMYEKRRDKQTDRSGINLTSRVERSKRAGLTT